MNVRATVISQSRNGARALAKEWECSSDPADNQKIDSQRRSSDIELSAIAYASWDRSTRPRREDRQCDEYRPVTPLSCIHL